MEFSPVERLKLDEKRIKEVGVTVKWKKTWISKTEVI